MPSTNFNQPIYPGAKTITVSGTITNVSGSCTQDILDERVAGSMRAIALDLGTPSIFNANISVECLAGKVRVTCDDVAGTSTISIVLLKTDDDPTALTSTEFDILNNRMTNLENVCTNSNVTIHTTDWVLTNSLYTYTWSNSAVDVNSCVEVYPLDGSESAGIDEFDFTHTTGQVVITTPVQPIADLPIMIRVIHAKLTSMNAEAISTEAISGCANVEEALIELDSNINNMGAYELLAQSTEQTTTEYTLNNSRKFSDYRYVFVAIEIATGASFQHQSSTMIPIGLLISYSQSYALALNVYTTQRYYATFQYVSDTKIKLSTSNSSYRVSIYGVK